MNRIGMLTAALALAAASPLAAQAQGFFELSIGQSEADVGDIAGASVDDTDTTFSFGGGYMFNPNLGVEAGYRDFGEVSVRGTLGGDDIDASVEASGFFGGLVTRLPLGERFNFTGRFGLLLWELDTSVRLNGIPAGSADDDGNDFYFGLGASYAVSNAMDLGLGWTRFDIDGDDVDAIELRTRFSF